MKKFENIVNAAKWAMEDGKPGDIAVVKLDIGWVPHVVEDNKCLKAICNCDGEEVVLHLDGEDADGIDATEDETIIYFNGKCYFSIIAYRTYYIGSFIDNNDNRNNSHIGTVCHRSLVLPADNTDIVC